MSVGSGVCRECGAWMGDNLHAKIRRQALEVARLRDERDRNLTLMEDIRDAGIALPAALASRIEFALDRARGGDA